jgi:hypothetical protein
MQNTPKSARFAEAVGIKLDVRDEKALSPLGEREFLITL